MGVTVDWGLFLYSLFRITYCAEQVGKGIGTGAAGVQDLSMPGREFVTDVLNFCFSMTMSLSATVRFLVVGLLLGMVAFPTAQAQQPEEIPRNERAELMFEQGLSAFEQGDYETAAERFRLVQDHELNRKTTAALTMQAKALVLLGRYEEAIEVVETLLERYPSTSYREEGREILEIARERYEEGQRRVDTLRIGVTLPMSGDTVTLSQALFNGIRLAVDEHNGLRRRYVPPTALRASVDSFEVVSTAEVYGDSLAEAEGQTTVLTESDTVRVDSLQVVSEQAERPRWIAKMYFRRTEVGSEGARAAVDSLVNRDHVDVILGPLYSETARAAGEVAERSRVPLLAPLATEESVSKGRDYVFQANPTIRVRGEIMAGFVANGLLIERASIIHERGSAGSSDIARMASAFREEAERQGVEVPFRLRLDNRRAWSRLPEAIDGDTLITDSMVTASEAFYVPMGGQNASGKIQDALSGLGRMESVYGREFRVLGNSRWHNLSVRREASTFTTTYATDFSVQTEQPEVQSFIRRYRLLTGQTPDELSTVRERRLAYTGYDIARFILRSLTPSSGGPQPSDIRSAPTYEGIGVRIDFESENVNRAMFFHRYRNNRSERIR